MVDVFISYSRRDLSFVAMLARAVENEGYAVWWDAELPPHQSYGDVITDKILNARAAIVVWSADSVKSEWVRAEADMARNQRKLVQTALHDVMPPLPFNQIQFAELGDWQGEADHPGWRKVKASLTELCGRAGPDEPRKPLAVPAGTPPLATKPANWPLIVGVAVAALALVGTGGLLLGQRSERAAPIIEPGPAGPSPSQAAPVPASPPEAPMEAEALAPVAPVPAPEPVDQPVAVSDAPLPPAADMTFPDSSSRLLTAAEVAQLGPATLRIARNEIFARKGRRFRDPTLRAHFSQFEWYRPRFDEVPLNPVERKNVALLREAEARFQ